MAGLADTGTSVSASASEDETQAQGARLAARLAGQPHGFVRLVGELGAGKSAFARGFIREWCRLHQDAPPESIASPTFNIARVYGSRSPVAHLDLYRVKSMAELEQLGFEHYFFELPCVLVEWLEQVPEALRQVPPHATVVTIEAGSSPTERRITVRSSRKTS